MRYIVVALLLAGCASPPYWVKGHEGLPREHIRTVDVVMSSWDSPGLGGYVIRDFETGTCHIMLKSGVNRDCVLAHERKHCAGYDHPDYRVGFICP
jgi:hypothetical protein